MMDRERFEIIKDKQMQMHALSTFDISWLIEQVGRVPLLETSIKRLRNRKYYLERLCEQIIGEEWMNDEGLYESEMMKLSSENKRLREALEHIEVNSNDKVAVFIANQALEQSP